MSRPEPLFPLFAGLETLPGIGPQVDGQFHCGLGSAFHDVTGNGNQAVGMILGNLEQLAVDGNPNPEKTEGDPFGGPVAMRLGGGGSWSTVGRTRLG